MGIQRGAPPKGLSDKIEQFTLKEANETFGFSATAYDAAHVVLRVRLAGPADAPAQNLSSTPHRPAQALDLAERELRDPNVTTYADAATLVRYLDRVDLGAGGESASAFEYFVGNNPNQKSVEGVRATRGDAL